MTQKRDRLCWLQGGLGTDLGIDTGSVIPGTDIVAMLARRREASWRLPPLACGCRDPLDHHRHRADIPVVVLSAALAALRRAWRRADDHDRATLETIAAVLKADAA